jgi:hypothetical protein
MMQFINSLFRYMLDGYRIVGLAVLSIDTGWLVVATVLSLAFAFQQQFPDSLRQRVRLVLADFFYGKDGFFFGIGRMNSRGSYPFWIGVTIWDEQVQVGVNFGRWYRERLIPVRYFSIGTMRKALANFVDQLIPQQLHGLQMGVAMRMAVAVFVAAIVFAAATGGYKGYQVIARLQAEPSNRSAIG